MRRSRRGTTREKVEETESFERGKGKGRKSGTRDVECQRIGDIREGPSIIEMMPFVGEGEREDHGVHLLHPLDECGRGLIDKVDREKFLKV